MKKLEKIVKNAAKRRRITNSSAAVGEVSSSSSKVERKKLKKTKSDLNNKGNKKINTKGKNNDNVVDGSIGKEEHWIVEASYLCYVDLVNNDVTLRPNISEESFQRYLVSINSNIEAFDILSKEYFQGLYLVSEFKIFYCRLIYVSLCHD